MDWLYIIGFIVLGLVFIAVEILLIPGTTIVGVIGAIITVSGIYLAYSDHGFMAGTATLFGALVGAGVLAWLSVKMLKSYAVEQVIDGRVNELSIHLTIGDTGVTTSVLRPMGNVKFGQKKIEVESRSGFIEKNEAVKVVKVDGNKIFVVKS